MTAQPPPQAALAMSLDHELSPHTGWTRAHWVALVDHILGSRHQYASPDQHLITYPGAPGG